MPLLDSASQPSTSVTPVTEAATAQAARRIGRLLRALPLPSGADLYVLTYPAELLLLSVLSALVGPGGQVIVFEHDRARLARIRRRLAEAELSNVTAVDDLLTGIGHGPFDRLLLLEPEASIRRDLA